MEKVLERASEKQAHIAVVNQLLKATASSPAHSQAHIYLDTCYRYKRSGFSFVPGKRDENLARSLHF